VLEKGYGRVTVRDIIDRADVGRSTFYSHFRDKEDLFLSGIEGEIREAFGSEPDEGSPSLWLFEHAREHIDLYRALIRRRGGWELVSERIEKTLVEIFEDRLRGAATSPVPVEAAARFLGSALIGLLAWWLSEDTPLEPDAIDAAFRALASRGTEDTLGTAF
jgi:AcrR family transcriptional regulator